MGSRQRRFYGTWEVEVKVEVEVEVGWVGCCLEGEEWERKEVVVVVGVR